MTTTAPPTPPDSASADAPATLDAGAAQAALRISVVIPVYRGEHTLTAVVEELARYSAAPVMTPGGRAFRCSEVLLVHDGAADASHEVMQRLAARFEFVAPIWLSRNFGQHAATLAGMAASTGDWVVTMDEDGMNDPGDIGRFLDAALGAPAQLVYGRPTNPPPHGAVRNAASAAAKWLFVHVLGDAGAGEFNSFRLVDGEIARSLAAYCGSSTYLDVALTWVVATHAFCPTRLRFDARPSGYSLSKLFSHFRRLLITSGTKPLRLVTLLGVLSLLLAVTISAFALWGRLARQIPVEGWTSLMIVSCWFFGCILFSLGIMAEYLGAALVMAMGKPLYLVVSRPSVRASRPGGAAGARVAPAPGARTDDAGESRTGAGG
ncbi:MAG: glycosyltransferase [Tepidisphaeraceae bacterium]